MIKLKIDVKKIDKERLYRGEKGTYLDAVLIENRDGRDKFGYDGFISQDVSKAERQAGEKGTIIGNWRDLSIKDEPQRSKPRQQSKPQGRTGGYGKPTSPPPDPTDEDSDIPF